MGVDAEMFVRTRENITPGQVRRWAYELGDAFYPEKFYRYTDHDTKERVHHLHLIDNYAQDGPDITPEPGETFVRVNLSTRYYGPGYERGDCAFIVMVAEWLERQIPGAEVWYGGDSSGLCAEKFDKAAREALIAHWVEHGCRPYNNYGMTAPGSGHDCPLCRVPMNQHGFGGGRGPDGQDLFASFSCHGCGFQKVTHDGRKTWKTYDSYRERERAEEEERQKA